MIAELHPERAVALASGLSLLLFGGIWLMFAVPFVRGVVSGLRANNWWAPFEQSQRGRYRVFASGRKLALFRAPEPARRTRTGLVTRWAFWTCVVVGLGYYPATLVVRLVQLAIS